MDFEVLRSKISDILGQRVAPGYFREAVQEAELNGRFQNKQIIGVITAIYEYLEANKGK